MWSGHSHVVLVQVLIGRSRHVLAVQRTRRYTVRLSNIRTLRWQSNGLQRDLLHRGSHLILELAQRFTVRNRDRVVIAWSINRMARLPGVRRNRFGISPDMAQNDHQTANHAQRKLHFTHSHQNHSNKFVDLNLKSAPTYSRSARHHQPRTIFLMIMPPQNTCCTCTCHYYCFCFCCCCFVIDK